MKLPLVRTAACITLSCSLATAQVVINEFSYDEASTNDSFEFIELYNAGSQAVNIGNWRVENDDQVSGQAVTIATFTIPTGTMLAPGGFWLMGSASYPNADQVIGATNIIDNGDNALVLRDAAGNARDAVIYEWNKQPTWTPPYSEGGIWGNFWDGPGLFSWSRHTDGYDTNENGRDFVLYPQTPGATNTRPDRLPVAETFNALTVGSSLDTLGGNPFIEAWFQDPLVINPTVQDTSNFTVLPASPDGGNAMTLWDVPGGNSAVLLTRARASLILECYVWLESAPTGQAGEYEAWSIGVQGTTDAFFNTTDYEGLANNTSGLLGCDYISDGCRQNGNTGVSWTYQRDNTGGKIMLIDHRAGGPQANVLAIVPITAGMNDGWQRIRLRATSARIEANLGGTYGVDDGMRFSERIYGEPGTVYFGFREGWNANRELMSRPPAIDLLTIAPPNGDLIRFGRATPWTGGVPKISSNIIPNVGDTNWRLEFWDNPPTSVIGWFLGFGRLAMPFDLTGIGLQPGSFLYIDPVLGGSLPTDANGDASLLLGTIPNLPALVGGALDVQSAALDTALPQTLPLAVSAGLEAVIGS